MSDANFIWNMIVEKLSAELTSTAVTTWIAPCEPVAFDGSHLVLRTPDEIRFNILSERFVPVITNHLRELLPGDDVGVILLTSKENYQGKKASKEDDNELPIIPGYSFADFIVGPSNKFAHAASIAVSEEPGKRFNPLFIYGNSGLGKTHLMLAIGYAVKKSIPQLKVSYVKGEAFMNELIHAIKEGSTEAFREKYRKVDVLLIDDIQFIIGKESTQEEFFHTFNALQTQGKQIILTSDKPPKEMETLEERIRSRFEWGLMADIGVPDYETRMAILRKKAESDKFDIDDEVLSYIANNIKSNVRELEGALNKLLAYNNLVHIPITMEIAEKELSNIITPDKPREITPQLIIEVVSEHFHISVDQMISKTRSSDVAKPRQIAMYLCKNMTDSPLDTIGSLLGGRDHSTIIHGIKKVTEEYDTNETTRTLIETIKKKINPN